MEVSGNTVKIHNPNINIPGSVAKALTNIGTGAAIEVVGVLQLMAHAVKASALPISVKFMGIITATNAANTTTQNNIKPSPSSKKDSYSSYPNSSVLEDV